MILIVTALFLFAGSGVAQEKIMKDTVIIKTIVNESEDVIMTDEFSEEDILISNNPCRMKKIKMNKDCCSGKMNKCQPRNLNRRLSWPNKLLVLLPLGLFFLVFFLILVKLHRDGFKLTDALRSDDSETPRLSISKLMAFLSVIAALLVIVVVLTFLIYCLMKGCAQMPSFKGAWVIVACLLIGIAPFCVRSLFRK